MPSALLRRATRPAHKGATALVPPTTVLVPSTRIWYPVAGSASPATSGTPRPPWPPSGGGTGTLDCHGGLSKTALTPPPLPFQAVSPLGSSRVVPPQPVTKGLEAGKSTWFRPSVAPSLDPSSPEAAKIVTPSAAPSAKAWFSASRPASAQSASEAPQLMETTLGLFCTS